MIVHAGRRRGLLHPQLQPVFLHLEFREVVLPHELENSFDVCEVHNWIVGDPCTPTRVLHSAGPVARSAPAARASTQP